MDRTELYEARSYSTKTSLVSPPIVRDGITNKLSSRFGNGDQISQSKGNANAVPTTGA